MQRMINALKDFDVYITSEEAQQFQEQYDIALHSIIPFLGVPELLTTLKNQGLPIGIITNGPVEHQSKKIQVLGLKEFISDDYIFISDGVGSAKPDPQIFRLVCDKVGCIPNQTLYIGDSWRNDIVASQLAGWHSIWFNHRKRQPDTNHKPFMEIDCLSSILDVFNINEIINKS